MGKPATCYTTPRNPAVGVTESHLRIAHGAIKQLYDEAVQRATLFHSSLAPFRDGGGEVRLAPGRDVHPPASVLYSLFSTWSGVLEVRVSYQSYKLDQNVLEVDSFESGSCVLMFPLKRHMSHTLRAAPAIRET
ncbi:hypothetical protein BAUCODRAFT_182375 [Baudoinia panamericana UAMH 10762]|uniref:Uncharacterized protein n=1 Tax=Baudoinia panamericana (strain UAMH 10762) TaxID=717646 RepID=M2MUX6_BAUPA|nr:uncharacterized protein BAUCODRAFT_182375 [Baudoinia panamericana UAMH 10762]EMD00752.1 hypothetical protein BAUCODRAFT_182375 [Baudoinia panamericana UAMH 10762]